MVFIYLSYTQQVVHKLTRNCFPCLGFQISLGGKEINAPKMTALSFTVLTLHENKPNILPLCKAIVTIWTGFLGIRYYVNE